MQVTHLTFHATEIALAVKQVWRAAGKYSGDAGLEAALQAVEVEQVVTSMYMLLKALHRRKLMLSCRTCV